MKRVWYRHARKAVLEALRRGQRPDLAITTTGTLLEGAGCASAFGDILNTFFVGNQRQVIFLAVGTSGPLLVIF